MGLRREIVETWGWPVVSFHGDPLQTQNHGQKSGPEDTALPVSAPPTSQGKCSVFFGLPRHKCGQPHPTGGAQHHLQES